MKLHQYTIALLVMLLGLPLSSAPLAGAEELSLDPVAETADEDTAKPKKKSKKKKASKKKTSKKKAKADDEQTEADDADDADDAADEKAADEKADKEEGKVAQALRKFKPVSGKPNLKADYYIYMYSASWCGYCKQCMPGAVTEYKKMRRKKVEFLVIGGDKSREEAAAYLKGYKAKMPCIYFDDVKATNFMGLPGCGMPGFPAISVVDKDGNIIKNVVGATAVKEVIENWKDYTIDQKKD